MSSYIEKREQIIKEHNTTRYIYKGNGEWDYCNGMSDETKNLLNTVHPEAKIGVVYIEHFKEGYPIEWSSEKLMCSVSSNMISFATNIIGKEAPHPTEVNNVKNCINRVDYTHVNRLLAKQGECTVRGRIYNDPSSPGPYVLVSMCGDVWEVQKKDGTSLVLYPNGREVWHRTFLHVPPGHYVDCAIRYLPSEQRYRITEVPKDAGDWTEFDVVGEGEIVSAPGLFAELE
jgi:hypothetical protein